MKRTTLDFRTEFTVGGVSDVVRGAASAAASFDAIAAAAKKAVSEQSGMSGAARAAIEGQRAVAEEMARVVREVAAAQGAAASAAATAAAKTVRSAEDLANGVGKATGKVKDHYDNVAEAARAAVKAAEDAGRIRLRDLSDELGGDEDAARDRLTARKRALDEARAARAGLKAPKPGASRSEQRDYDAKVEAADFLVRNFEDQVTAAERGLKRLQRELKRLMEDAEREEAEKVRVVREAEDQKVQAVKRRVDQERRLEAEAVLAAQKAAEEKIKAAERAAKAAERDAQREVTRQTREIAAMSKAAQKAYERSQSKRDISADVEAGLRDPGKLRTDAAAAAQRFAERAEATRKRAAEAQERIAAFEGSAAEKKKFTTSENRSLGQYTRHMNEAEAESRRLAEILTEVERRLARTAEEAKKAAAAIDSVLAAAVKRQNALRGKQAFERDLDLGLRNPGQAKAAADAYAKAYEAALARVVKAAQQAKAAIAVAMAVSADNPAEVDRVKAAEGAKVAAAQSRANRMDILARRTAAVSEEVARQQAAAADAAGRANERAAKRAAKAWEDSQKRLNKIRKALPSLFGNRPSGFFYRLQADGTLSMMGGLLRGVGGVVGSVLSIAGTAGRIAFGALSGVAGVLMSIVGAAGQAAAGVVRIGVSAVTAAGRLAVNLGSSALSVLGKLGGAAVDAAAKVAGIARTVVIRAVVAGGGAAVAGYAGAKKAVSDSATAAKETYDGMLASGTGFNSFQRMGAAARKSGVDMGDFTTAMQTARSQMQSLADNPTLVHYFKQLGVGTHDFWGRARDVNVVLQELIVRSRQLAPYDKLNLFSNLFGYENMEKILPLVRGLMNPNDGLLALAEMRQRQLGAFILPEDVFRMRTFKAASYDLEDAWKGLKLTIARTVGDDVIRAMVNFATFIGKNRGAVAQFARVAFDVGLAMKEVVVNGRDMAAEVRKDLWGAGFLRGVLTAVLWTRTLGIEAWNVFKAFRQAERTGKGVTVMSTAPVFAAVNAIFVLKNAVVSTVPFFREFWAAATGQDARVVRYGWMLDVRRVAADMWRTVRGRDGEVAPNHRWMVTIREDLFKMGRFAREAWAAVRGQTERVDEFPILLTIRTKVLDTFQWMRDFAREAWLAVTGQSAGVAPRFPWMQETRARVEEFVASMKAQWADLQAVWAGGDPSTALGQRLAGVIKTVTYYRDQAVKLWEDLKHVFAGEIGSDVAFNFPGLKEAAQDFQAIKEKVVKAYEIFKVLFTYIDSTVQRFTFGKVDLATLALVTGFLTMFGVVRVAMGAFIVMRGAASLLGKALGGTAAAAAGGAAGAAGGGVAGALGRAGNAAEQAGRRANSSAGAWGTLVNRFKSLGSYLAGNPALLGLLGLGGSVAGGMISDNSTSYAGKLFGGAVQGAGTGAMWGSFAGPKGAAVGAVLGGAYGLFAGRSEYYRQHREELLDQELRRQGHGDLADQRAAARAAAASGAPQAEDDGDDEVPAVPGARMRPAYVPAYADTTRYPDAVAAGEADQERALAAGMERLAEQMRQMGGTGVPGPAAAQPLARGTVPGADVAAVRRAMEEIGQGRAPSQADYVRGVIGGVPPADAYSNSASRSLYLNSPYSRTPFSAPAAPAPSTAPGPQASAGDTFNIDLGLGRVLTWEGTQTGRQKADFKAQLARITATPLSGATA